MAAPAIRAPPSNPTAPTMKPVPRLDRPLPPGGGTFSTSDSICSLLGVDLLRPFPETIASKPQKRLRPGCEDSGKDSIGSKDAKSSSRKAFLDPETSNWMRESLALSPLRGYDQLAPDVTAFTFSE